MSKVWNILIIDKSSSMFENKKLIRDGYNILIKEQIENKSENRFTVFTFNTFVEKIRDEYFPNVKEITEDEYKTFGLTCLLDAIGIVYEFIQAQTDIKNIVITLITDGVENSSTKYNKGQLNDIKEKLNKYYKIKFIFIGTNNECIKNNVLNSHVNKSINCNGDVMAGMRSISKSMSSHNSEFLDNSSNKRSLEYIQYKNKCIKSCNLI